MKQLVLGILAHVDAGKTTLSEALLYRTGAIRDLGRVDHKNAHMDTHALERARGITIFSRQARMTLGDVHVTLLDTPGHVDFSAEMERTHIEQRGADAAYTEDGEHFIDLPGDTTVSMNFWGFSPLYLRELAQRFPAFLDENLPRNPLKCEYFVPSIVDAQLHAGTADVTMLHTDDAWHCVT